MQSAWKYCWKLSRKMRFRAGMIWKPSLPGRSGRSGGDSTHRCDDEFDCQIQSRILCRRILPDAGLPEGCRYQRGKDFDPCAGRKCTAGTCTGDEIEWPKPGGGVLRVRIVEVTYQPERSGEYYR